MASIPTTDLNSGSEAAFMRALGLVPWLSQLRIDATEATGQIDVRGVAICGACGVRVPVRLTFTEHDVDQICRFDAASALL